MSNKTTTTGGWMKTTELLQNVSPEMREIVRKLMELDVEMLESMTVRVVGG